MKRAALILISVGAFIAPTSALAGPVHATRCRTSEPGFVSYLGTLNTSCTTARAVERYWTTHEMLAPARIVGLRWRAEAWNATQTTIVSGKRIVYIVHRPSN